MDLELARKVALVTGASRGIGLAITRGLVAEGARVVAGARDGSDELLELAKTDSVEVVLVDLTSRAGAGELVDAAIETYGDIDVLVNNVGAVRPRLDGFGAISDDEWQWAMEINFLAAVRTTRAALPHLVARAPSSIVTVCSVNASLPDPGVLDYSAAKGALRTFCKGLSKEVGPSGVRVNTISPGPVETALWLGADGVANTLAQASGSDPASVAEAAVAGTATRRFTRPEEVADLVLVLASGRTGNVTGADFLIDGGMTTSL